MRPIDWLAQGMYNAYGESTGWKNYQGNPMPQWEDLGERVQAAWVAAAIYAVGEFHQAILEVVDDMNPFRPELVLPKGIDRNGE